MEKRCLRIVLLAALVGSTAIHGGCAARNAGQIESQLTKIERDLASLAKADTELRIRVDELTATVEQLDGRLKENEDRVNVLVTKVSQLQAPPPPAARTPSVRSETIGPPPGSGPAPGGPAGATGATDGVASLSPDQLYHKAYAAHAAGDYSSAILLFEEFIARYPDNKYVDNARYWIGESYYSQRDYRNAIDQFTRVIKDYPEGNKVPDAMLKLGFAYYELQEYERARAELQRLVDKYPYSSAADRARQKLALIDSER